MSKIILLMILVITVFIHSGFSANAITNNFGNDNLPPSEPKINGPTNIRPGTYEFTFNATDPDGDNISYKIDWGDGSVTGWIGPYGSGVEINQSHTFSRVGTYLIRAKAKDIHGAEGPWGDNPVRIPVSDQMIPSFFLQFLTRYIEHFPMLNWIFLFHSSLLKNYFF